MGSAKAGGVAFVAGLVVLVVLALASLAGMPVVSRALSLEIKEIQIDDEEVVTYRIVCPEVNGFFLPLEGSKCSLIEANAFDYHLMTVEVTKIAFTDVRADQHVVAEVFQYCVDDVLVLVLNYEFDPEHFTTDDPSAPPLQFGIVGYASYRSCNPEVGGVVFAHKTAPTHIARASKGPSLSVDHASATQLATITE